MDRISKDTGKRKRTFILRQIFAYKTENLNEQMTTFIYKEILTGGSYCSRIFQVNSKSGIIWSYRDLKRP